MPTNLCEDGADYSYLLIIQHPQGGVIWLSFFQPGLESKIPLPNSSHGKGITDGWYYYLRKILILFVYQAQCLSLDHCLCPVMHPQFAINITRVSFYCI